MPTRRDGLVAAVGCASLGFGLFLVLSPGTARKTLGWERYTRLARIVGAGDLILGAGLLFDHEKARWMMARSLMNLLIVAIYAHALFDRGPGKRVTGGLGAMSGPLIVDYLLLRSLRKDRT